MVCYFPMSARKSAQRNAETGKFGVTFSGTKALIEGSKMLLPCGLCVGCRIDRAEGWAIRGAHEAQMVEADGRRSCFITLTYADEHLPDSNSVRKAEWQNFMKRLRQAVAPLKVRFLACGEYGGRRGRAHYHGIIYGYDFPDRKWYRETPRGERVYVSAQLKELWPFGLHEIGSVTFQSARYVAGYVMKKLGGVKAEAYYRPSPVTGEMFHVEPEFQLSSRMPGLGQSWFEKFKSDVFPHDHVVLEGRPRKVPRYYEKLLPADELEAVKRARRVRGRTKADDNTWSRRQAKAECREEADKRIVREVD